MSIDWKGVSLALAQLKELSEPSKFELMEHEYHLRGIEQERQQMFDAEEKKFNLLYEDWKQNKTDMEEIKNNISDISVEALNLSAENQSSPETMSKILKDTDYATADGLRQSNQHIQGMVESDLQKMNDYAIIYDNAMFGKQLFQRQMNVDGYYLGDQVDDREQISNPEYNADDAAAAQANEESYGISELMDNPDYGKHSLVTNWDTDGKPGISKQEYQNALDGTIRLMRKQASEKGVAFDERGIKEGFWSEFNMVDNQKESLQLEEQFWDTLEANGYDVTDPSVEAYLKSSEKYLEKSNDYEYNQKLYFDKVVDERKIEYEMLQSALQDNEHPYWNELSIKMDSDGSNDSAQTTVRTKARNRIAEILVEAHKNGASHYFVDLNNTRLNQAFATSYTYGKDMQLDTAYTEGLSDFGLDMQLYKNLGNTPIPTYETDNANKTYHTGYLDDAQSKKIGMEQKAMFEDIYNVAQVVSKANTVRIDGMQAIFEDPTLAQYYGNEEEMKEIAARFNNSMDEFELVYPESFEGKGKLRLKVFTDENGDAQYNLIDEINYNEQRTFDSNIMNR